MSLSEERREYQRNYKRKQRELSDGKLREQEIRKRYKEKHPEKFKELAHNYYLRHRERILKRNKLYKQRSPAHVKEKTLRAARANMRARWKRDPEKEKRISRKHYIAHAAKLRLVAQESRYKRFYGLSLLQVRHLHQINSGKCWICGRSFEGLPRRVGPCIDHDHLSKKIRGVLCIDCNLLLSDVRDDPSTLKKCIDYLDSHRSGSTREKLTELWGEPLKWRRNIRLEGNNPLRRGVPLLQLEKLLKHQQYRCAICSRSFEGTSKRWPLFRIDHDHTTDEIRGLLCDKCNVALGHAHDKTEILSSAMEYLVRPTDVLKQLYSEMK